MNENGFGVITKISWLYYVNNCTQQEIADRMNLSRTKVTRHLQKARELGIVNITISMDHSACYEKEEQLKKILKLEEVTVVPSGPDKEDVEQGIGIAGAMRMNKILSADDVLGVAWGKALYNVGKNLVPVKSVGDKVIQVVQLMGGLTVSAKINPEEIVQLIARRLNAKGYLLNVPAVVSTKEAREVLMNDENISRVFKKILTCNKCMLGLGNLTESSSLYITGALNKRDLEELKEAGAVGDIISRAYDINGNPVNTSLSEKLIAASLNDIKKIEKRLGFASGIDKVKCIIGAARGGYINELITDEDTADEIIKVINFSTF